MIDLSRAFKAFEAYVSHYDKDEPSISLKYHHTYEVVKISETLCGWLHLNEEDTHLAMLIALLHDIGRFEQYRIYHSFIDHQTIDHALFSSELLFEKGLIRDFIEEDQYDEIIRISIEQHNKYTIDNIDDERIMKFVYIIRDADKLDNFRVKEEEEIETLFNISQSDLEKEYICDQVYDQFMNHELIYKLNRETHLDMWISYMAFIYDLHFDESLFYVYEHDWVDRLFSRIQPIDQRYNELWRCMKNYVSEKIGSSRSI